MFAGRPFESSPGKGLAPAAAVRKMPLPCLGSAIGARLLQETRTMRRSDGPPQRVVKPDKIVQLMEKRLFWSLAAGGLLLAAGLGAPQTWWDRG